MNTVTSQQLNVLVKVCHALPRAEPSRDRGDHDRAPNVKAHHVQPSDGDFGFLILGQPGNLPGILLSTAAASYTLGVVSVCVHDVYLNVLWAALDTPYR
jgi:hypothetical protein